MHSQVPGTDECKVTHRRRGDGVTTEAHKRCAETCVVEIIPSTGSNQRLGSLKRAMGSMLEGQDQQRLSISKTPLSFRSTI